MNLFLAHAGRPGARFWDSPNAGHQRNDRAQQRGARQTTATTLCGRDESDLETERMAADCGMFIKAGKPLRQTVTNGLSRGEAAGRRNNIDTSRSSGKTEPEGISLPIHVMSSLTEGTEVECVFSIKPRVHYGWRWG